MRGLKIFSLLFFVVIFLCGTVFASTDNSFVSYKSSHLWGFARDVAVSDSYAFYPKKYGLEVIDLTNPLERNVAARLLLSEESVSIDISGSHAFLGLKSGGLTIVDISNPEAPLWISSYFVEGKTNDITVAGDIAFLSQEDLGVYLINIADPNNPLPVSYFATAGDPGKIAIAGDILYITELDFGLEVVNITTPSSPLLIGNFDGIGSSNGADYHDIIVSGDFAFIIDHASSASNGLTVLDISDPAHPELSYSENLNWAFSLYLDGTTLYISTETTGIYAFDVTSPSNPVLLDHCMDHVFVNHLAKFDNYLISASRYNPYFDISDPNNISLSSYNSLMSEVANVFVSGDYAYIAHYFSGLTILNISNPDLPVVASNLATTGRAYEVEVINQIAYVSNGGGMDMVNVSDPANPYIIGTFHDSDSTGCEEFTIVDNLAYITAYPYHAYIVDISNPASPVQIAEYSPEHPSYSDVIESITPYGDYAYVCTPYTNEVEIIDISNPAEIVKVGSYTNLNSPMNCTFVGNYVLVSSFNNGTDILDVSDPVNPVKVNHIDADSQYELGATGDLLFFGDGYDGFDIYDFSDIANPSFIGKYDTPGAAQALESDGQFIYVADRSGFLIMELNLPAYQAGDINGDATVNVGDAVFMINYVFKGGAAPVPIEAGDVNCDDDANVGDAVYLINFVFKNGPEPCFPQ